MSDLEKINSLLDDLARVEREFADTQAERHRLAARVEELIKERDALFTALAKQRKKAT